MCFRAAEALFSGANRDSIKTEIITELQADFDDDSRREWNGEREFSFCSENLSSIFYNSWNFKLFINL